MRVASNSVKVMLRHNRPTRTSCHGSMHRCRLWGQPGHVPPITEKRPWKHAYMYICIAITTNLYSLASIWSGNWMCHSPGLKTWGVVTVVGPKNSTDGVT